MKRLLPGLFSGIVLAIAFQGAVARAESTNEGKPMAASGSFTVQLEPQSDDLAPAGRLIIIKEYSGGMVGHGAGQMVSKRVEGGASVYGAVEEFTGSVDGRGGSFTLFHNGHINSAGVDLSVIIVEGSGTGELAGINGELIISQNAEGHQYELRYQLD